MKFEGRERLVFGPELCSQFLWILPLLCVIILGFYFRNPFGIAASCIASLYIIGRW